jgi:hypothetical protein
MDALIYNKIETEAQRIIDAVASSGSVIKVGETILEEPDYKIQVNLPENWSELYDCLIAVADMSGGGDYVYAPFSASSASGSYITNPPSTWSTVLVVYKSGDNFMYRGFNNTGSVITPGTADYFTLRFYNSVTKQFDIGTRITVYGFKTNTNT